MKKYLPLETQDEDGNTPIADAIDDARDLVNVYIRDDLNDLGSGTWDNAFDVCVDIAKNVLATFKEEITGRGGERIGIFEGNFFSKPYAKGTPARVVRRDVCRIIQAVVNKYAGTYESFVIKFLDEALSVFSEGYEALEFLAGCVRVVDSEGYTEKNENTEYGRTDTNSSFFDAYQGTSAGLENGNTSTAGGSDSQTSADNTSGRTRETSGKTIAEMTKGVEGVRSMAKLLWTGLVNAFILDDDELEEWEKAPAEGWIGA